MFGPESRYTPDQAGNGYHWDLLTTFSPLPSLPPVSSVIKPRLLPISESLCLESIYDFCRGQKYQQILERGGAWCRHHSRGPTTVVMMTPEEGGGEGGRVLLTTSGTLQPVSALWSRASFIVNQKLIHIYIWIVFLTDFQSSSSYTHCLLTTFNQKSFRYSRPCNFLDWK